MNLFFILANKSLSQQNFLSFGNFIILTVYNIWELTKFDILILSDNNCIILMLFGFLNSHICLVQNFSDFNNLFFCLVTKTLNFLCKILLNFFMFNIIKSVFLVVNFHLLYDEFILNNNFLFFSKNSLVHLFQIFSKSVNLFGFLAYIVL